MGQIKILRMEDLYLATENRLNVQANTLVPAYTFWFLPFYISAYTTLNELLAVFFIYNYKPVITAACSTAEQLLNNTNTDFVLANFNNNKMLFTVTLNDYSMLWCCQFDVLCLCNKVVLQQLCNVFQRQHLSKLNDREKCRKYQLKVGVMLHRLPGWQQLSLGLRLRSHKHEYESGTVRVPVYEIPQTRACVYFNGGRSHTYEYELPVNFTRMNSFCAGHVFIQPVQSKLPVNNNNIIYKSCGIFDVRTDIIVKLFIIRGVWLVKLLAMW